MSKAIQSMWDNMTVSLWWGLWRYKGISFPQLCIWNVVCGIIIFWGFMLSTISPRLQFVYDKQEKGGGMILKSFTCSHPACTARLTLDSQLEHYDDSLRHFDNSLRCSPWIHNAVWINTNRCLLLNALWTDHNEERLKILSATLCSGTYKLSVSNHDTRRDVIKRLSCTIGTQMYTWRENISIGTVKVLVFVAS